MAKWKVTTKNHWRCEKSEDDGTVDVAAYEFENGGNIERGLHIEGYHK
jgi:hypothetical protein